MIKIRNEQPDDNANVRNVHLQAFETETEANLVDALRNAGIELISLVAEDQGEVIGHILFSPVEVEGSAAVMGLAPMAVLPEWQRQGVGTKLINEGLKVCERSGYDAVVVLGFPEYYPRFGFTASVKYGITSEYDVPPEVFMVKELRKGALQSITGTVRYHQAFNDVE